MILCVVFVVLMILWAFLGYRDYTPDKRGAIISTAVIPWLCVAILGWIIFNGSSYPMR